VDLDQRSAREGDGAKERVFGEAGPAGRQRNRRSERYLRKLERSRYAVNSQYSAL
jgi:hypothetical protein